MAETAEVEREFFAMKRRPYREDAILSQKPSTIRAATAILREGMRRGLSIITLRGDVWFRSVLLPAAHCVETAAHSANQRHLAGETWYLIGDVYWCNDAYHCAIAAYERAIRADPPFLDAVIEIADAWWTLEDYAKAATYYRRAIRLAPDDATLREHLADCLRRQDMAAGKPAKKAARVSPYDLLARGRATDALAAVAGSRSRKALCLRAIALGAMGQTDEALNTWCRRLAETGTIWLSTPEWFYLPEAFWESPRFWKLLLSCVGRIGDLVLDAPHGSCQGPPSLCAEDPVDWRTIHAAALRYHLARTQGDARTLARLVRRYPEWQEVRVVLEHVHRHGKSPTARELIDLVPRRPRSRRKIGN